MYEYDEECLQTFLNMQSQLLLNTIRDALKKAAATN